MEATTPRELSRPSGPPTMPDAPLPPERTSAIRRSGGAHAVETSLAPGTTIAARFEVVRRLGAGGMGTVYEAIDRRIGRKVALKILRDDLSADSVAVARFEREARAASRIVSPGVVTIHDFGRDPSGALYLVMELLVGESLLARMHRDPPTTETAIVLAADIAATLAPAHDAGVVHRDLKPDNVFSIEGGGLKVLDFGIASILDDAGGPHGRALTQQTAIVGTPLYMSPEAIQKLPVGPAADLYSLGVMLYELVSGRPPFDDLEPIVLLGKHVRETPRRLSEAAPSAGVPPELDRLVASLLEKRPAARPSSAREVERTLRSILAAGLPPEARARRRPLSDDVTAVVRPTARRSRAPSIVIAAAVLLIALGLVAYGTGGPAPIVATPMPVRAPEPAAAPAPSPPIEMPAAAEITITVHATPETAALTWDGVAVTTPFRAARDGADHELAIEAPGHERLVVPVRADRDHDVAPVLSPTRPTRPRRGGEREPPTPHLRGW